MAKKIAIFRGHPDPQTNHFCDAILASYQSGAIQSGHEVRFIDVAALEFDVLRTRADWESGVTPKGLVEAQEAIFWADHLVFAYPLWLGTMPALFKAFLEQVLRSQLNKGGVEGNPIEWRKLLKGASARIFVTMGMPAFFYRAFYRAHGLKVLERNILGLIGVKPVRSTIYGMIENVSDAKRQSWLNLACKLGREAR